MVKKDDAAPILSLDFDSKPSVSGQVRKLLPTIEHYKEQEGYSLRQIYDALHAEAHVQCAWPSFQNTYYRVRKESAMRLSAEEATPSQPTSPSKPPRMETNVVSSKNPPSSGLDLAVHQAKARAVFDRKLLP